MIISSRDLEASALENVDLCIVGAGAAGLTLACELDGCALKVVVLEAGSYRQTGASLDFLRGTASAPHPELTQYRRSALGGTTSVWGGRCVALDPSDLEAREWVPQSGWPMSFAELVQYYPRALAYCDAGKFDFTVAGSLAQPAPTIEGFSSDGTVLADRIERYSLPTDFGARYRRRLRSSANVTTVLQAHCVRLHKRPGDDSIESVEFLDRARRRRRLRARVVVLAAGGIEVPRLLLASAPEGPGLGNSHDLVGRFYSCHFETTCARLFSNGARVAFDFERTTDGVYCRRQLRLSADAQREHELLNVVFRLHFSEYSNPAHGSSVMSAIYLAKSLLPTEYRRILQHGKQDAGPAAVLPHVRNVLGGLPRLLRFGSDWLFRMRLAQRKLPYTLVANSDGSFPVEFNSEQSPVASNRVLLLPEEDLHGVKRAQVIWRLQRADAERAHRAFVLLRQSINSRSRCRLEFDDEQLIDQLRAAHRWGGHHIGTARMARSSQQGVVGPDCAVFGLANLFIASSAVFPTSGYANPTLTIVALAVRLAEHIKRELATVPRARGTTPAS